MESEFTIQDVLNTVRQSVQVQWPSCFYSPVWIGFRFLSVGRVGYPSLFCIVTLSLIHHHQSAAPAPPLHPAPAPVQVLVPAQVIEELPANIPHQTSPVRRRRAAFPRDDQGRVRRARRGTVSGPQSAVQ